MAPEPRTAAPHRVGEQGNRIHPSHRRVALTIPVTGKTKDLAEKDAWNKAQADARKGCKVKHCRTESSSKK